MGRSKFIRGLLDDPRDPQLPQSMPENDFGPRAYGLLNALFPDPYEAAGEAVRQFRAGNPIDAFTTMYGAMPATGAIHPAAKARAVTKEISSIGAGLEAPARARAADPRMYHYGLNEEQKLSRPIGEMFASYKPVEGYSAPVRITPEFFEGKNASLIPAVGDRTRGGALLTGVNGKILQRPTELQSGHEFQYGPAANGPDGAAWASADHVIDGLLGRTRAEAAAGFNPFLAYSAMHGTSADFSHHIAEPIIDLLRSGEAKVGKRDIAAFDDMMRNRTDNGWAAYGDFPGLLSPDAEKWFFSGGRGKARTKMAQMMSQADIAKQGFPDIPSLRFGTMDLGLLDAAPYGIGRSITKLDPIGRKIENPVIPHNTYETQIGKDRDVGYVGGFKYDLPPYVTHKEWIDQAIAENPFRAKNPSALIKSFTMSAPAARMTPEVIDRSMKYIQGVDRGDIIPPGVGDSRAFLWGSPYYQK